MGQLTGAGGQRQGIEGEQGVAAVGRGLRLGTVRKELAAVGQEPFCLPPTYLSLSPGCWAFGRLGAGF